jgi:hypothetical protein
MIQIENEEVVGWEPAIRGMRNPLNSWKKSDTTYLPSDYCVTKNEDDLALICGGIAPLIGENDLSLMKKLSKAGTDHRKFMRMIVVYADITAPMYWWKEFDTYKVGTVRNSCSTMHKITEKKFELSDFSHENLLLSLGVPVLKEIIRKLNRFRDLYINGIKPVPGDGMEIEPKDKNVWYQLIQLLPSSYNQRSTVMLNYEVLANIYHSRKNHKLDEWHSFCGWIEGLPYSEIITGGAE